MELDTILLARVFACGFVAACLIQSGLDKLFDWKGNLEWLNGHFAKTPFKSGVPALLAVVMAMEVVAGFAAAMGVVVLLIGGPIIVPQAALGLACLNFVFLLAGQRIAKDYAGAATIVSYFGVSLLGLALMSARI